MKQKSSALELQSKIYPICKIRNFSDLKLEKIKNTMN